MERLKAMPVHASGLSVIKNDRTILDAIDLALPPETLVALVGPNGAGKSTLLRALCGLETLAHGRVQVEGHGDMRDLPASARARLIGWVPEHASAPFAFSALDTTLLGRYPWHQGAPTAKDRERAEAALTMLGIVHLAARPVDTFSSGELRKVMIARGLAGDTPLLMLDEPCANLDVGATLKLLALLKAEVASGRTVCLTVHDLGLAYRYADLVIVMNEGRLVRAAPPAEALTPPCLAEVFGIDAEIVIAPSGSPLLHIKQGSIT